MKEDPNEWNNLAKDKSQEEEIKGMKKFIPNNWAQLSSFSTYNFNEYFIEKSGEKK